MHLENYLDIKEEVKTALIEGRPVLALESTIISHGMPYPQNVETAARVENIVREQGVIPATIGILNGTIKVGLTEKELEYMGRTPDVKKTSLRDIPFIVSMGLDGATTVASTMVIAEMAGIMVFVTGGIGGVHRGAEKTFDISADLQTLSNCSVAVVCAGAKSILDIGLTLEYLETQGVPVIGYKTDDFPAFYTRKSGFKVDYRADSAQQVATALKVKWNLGLKGAAVIGNPLAREHEMDQHKINAAIEEALSEAERRGIKGKETTPFLLDRLQHLTGGESLKSNVELVCNNARSGAEIASALSS